MYEIADTSPQQHYEDNMKMSGHNPLSAAQKVSSSHLIHSALWQHRAELMEWDEVVDSIVNW
jgi:hypothetical protein